jgi:hypothetical protein
MKDIDRKVIEITRGFADIKAVPYLMDDPYDSTQFGADNLGQLVAEFIVGIEKNIVENNSKQVLFLNGLPKSGKTWVRRNIEELLRNSESISHVYEQNRIRFRTWEEAEVNAAEMGEISTEITRPFEVSELRASHRHLDFNVYSDLNDPDVVGLVIEAPGLTSLTIGGKRVGRELGSRVGEKLALRRPPYNKFSYDLFEVALLAGPSLRHIEAYYQTDLKSARTYQEACMISESYGKSVLGYDEWIALVSEGASIAQVEFIEQAVGEMINTMESNKLISIPPIEVFEFMYSEEIALLIPKQEVYKAHRAWALGFAMRKILRDIFRIPSGNVFIGYNNPPLESLKIEDRNKLAESIRSFFLDSPYRHQQLLFQYLVNKAKLCLRSSPWLKFCLCCSLNIAKV